MIFISAIMMIICGLAWETQEEPDHAPEEVVDVSALEENVEKEQRQSVIWYTEKDAEDIAKVLYNECRGVPSMTERACVAWTILNRVDKTGGTIYGELSAPHQFAYNSRTPVDDGLLELACDVLSRWNAEKNGEEHVGRVLPKEFLWFSGFGGHNHFRNKYDGDFRYWDYSMESPYEN